jgi:hypothetical protein
MLACQVPSEGTTSAAPKEKHLWVKSVNAPEQEKYKMQKNTLLNGHVTTNSYYFSGTYLFIRHGSVLNATAALHYIEMATDNYNAEMVNYIFSDLTNISDIDTEHFHPNIFLKMARNMFSTRLHRRDIIRWAIIPARYDLSLFLRIAAKQAPDNVFELKVFMNLDQALRWPGNQN